MIVKIAESSGRVLPARPRVPLSEALARIDAFYGVPIQDDDAESEELGEGVSESVVLSERVKRPSLKEQLDAIDAKYFFR